MTPRRPHTPPLLALFGAILASGVLFAIAALPFVGSAGWMVNASSRTMNSNLEDISTHASLPLTTTITDRTGAPIAWLYTQRRTEVPSEAISEAMKQSIVAIEDRRFYEHSGVDLRGALRAMVANVSSGGVDQGASTINQQYVKNYLWLISAGSDAERSAATATSIPRKLREMKMASQLNEQLTKDEILTRYLNLISFGRGAFGVEAAAQTYFGVSAAELSDAQAALLAGVVQQTSGLDPYTNPDGALARRNTVLQARADAGSLSPAAAAAAAAEPLGVLEQPQVEPNGCIGAGNSGFFCDYALAWLAQHGMQRDDIVSGGYTIRTTLDPQAQAAAEQAARAQVNPGQNGVAGVLNYLTPTKDSHEVVAMATSRDYGLDAEAGQTVLPLTHALEGHGAGSVFKLFAAALALDKGMTLDTMLDVPARLELDGMGDGGAKNCPPGKYCVENAGPYPPRMTFRDALAHSPNTPFVTMAGDVGVDNVVDLAVKMGLRSYTQPDSFRPGASIRDVVAEENLGSFVLGPTQVDPLELSNVAATLVDKGRWCEPSPILSVTDREGMPVEIERARCEQALKPEIAAALMEGMGADSSQGTAADAARAMGWQGPVAAKTGTTETSYSAAFLGATGRWAGASYLFNDGPTSAPLCTGPARQCPDGNLFGGNEPARMWFAASAGQVDRYGGRVLPPVLPRFVRPPVGEPLR